MLIMICINAIICLQKGRMSMSRFIKVSAIIAAVALMLLLVPLTKPKEVNASPKEKEAQAYSGSGLIVEYDEDGNVIKALSSISLDD